MGHITKPHKIIDDKIIEVCLLCGDKGFSKIVNARRCEYDYNEYFELVTKEIGFIDGNELSNTNTLIAIEYLAKEIDLSLYKKLIKIIKMRLTRETRVKLISWACRIAIDKIR